MNKIFGIILAVVAMVGTTTASAGKVYVTGQVAHNNWDVDDVGGLDSTYGGGLGVGYNINKWLAVEATADHLGSDIIDGTKYQARSAVAWLVVDPTITTIGKMPLKVTARVGYAKTKIATSNGNETDSDPAYGVGVALGVAKNTEVFVDYRRRTVDIDNSDETVEFKSANLGVKYTF